MKQIFYLSVVVMLISCDKNSLSTAEMKNILHERNEKLGNYFKEGDVSKLIAIYTDSAKLCADGQKQVLIGKAAIQKFWTAASEGSKLLEMKTETLTVDGNKEIIYETGITSTKTLYNDSVYESTVKFVNVWKLQTNGEYKLDVDIWNTVE